MGLNTDAANAAPGSLQVHHVGIVATDEAQIARFRDAMGLVEEMRERIPKYSVTNVFLSGGPGAKVHFMLPEKGVLKNFNRGRGGLHHIAFAVPDVAAAQRQMEATGLQFIAPVPQQGIGTYRFNFVHPNLAGINVEFIQDPAFRIGE